MMKRRIATVAAMLMVAVGLLAGAPPASAATTESTNQCLFGPRITTVGFANLDGEELANGDRIFTIRSPNQVLQEGSVRFVLQSAQNVRAYKELRAENSAGAEIAAVFTNGDLHGPVGFTVPLSIVHQLFFLKAKAFGVVCPVYKLPRSQIDTLRAGDLVVFTWLQD